MPPRRAPPPTSQRRGDDLPPERRLLGRDGLRSDHSGQIKRRSVFGRSLDEAREKLDELRASCQRHRRPRTAGRPSPEFLDHWLARDQGRPSGRPLSGLRVRGPTAHRAGARSATNREAHRRRRPAADRRMSREVPVLRQPLRPASAGGEAVLLGRTVLRATPSKRQIQFIHAVLRNALGQRRTRRSWSPATWPSSCRSRRRATASARACRSRTRPSCSRKPRRPGSTRCTSLRRRWGCGGESCSASGGRTSTSTRHAHRGADRPAGRRPVGRRRHEVRGVGGDRAAAADHPTGAARASRPPQQERAELGEIWQDHGLVFPTGVGTPMEPRSLNRHFDGSATAPVCRPFGCTTFGIRWSRCCWNSGPSARGAGDRPPRRLDVTLTSTPTPTSTPCARRWTASTGRRVSARCYTAATCAARAETRPDHPFQVRPGRGGGI